MKDVPVKFQHIEQLIKNAANILTLFRTLGSILLLFLPVFSVAFYITYLFCGFSDMIDGTVARKTNSASEFGAKIDTAADLMFVTTALIKLLPAIPVPGWLWIWGGVIAMIKIGNIAWGYTTKKQFISLHTVMNKVTGALLFLLPLILTFVELKYSCIAVCSIATFAAIQEAVYIAAGCEHSN